MRIFMKVSIPVEKFNMAVRDGSFAGHAAGYPALGLAPAVSISNRFMITTYCLWFAVAAWGPARHAS